MEGNDDRCETVSGHNEPDIVYHDTEEAVGGLGITRIRLG